MTVPSINVALWNVRTGRSWQNDIIPVLNDKLPEVRPHVLFLLECYTAPWSLVGKVDGYSRAYHAYGYPKYIGGRATENGATAVLFRDGVGISERNPIVMSRNWTGPHGVKHHPRIHRETEVVVGGHEWDLAGIHGPFGWLSRRETNQAAVTFLKGPGRRAIVGDFNQSRDKVAARIARPAGARVDGKGIDLLVHDDDLFVADSYNLGKLGSDHDFKGWLLRDRVSR